MTPDALAERLRTRELELHATRKALAEAKAEYALAMDGIARIVGASGQEDAIERTLETVRTLLGASEAFLLVSGNTTSGFVRATTHERWSQAPRWPWQGVLARAQRGRAAIVHQPERLPIWLERPTFQRQNVGSMLVAPVTMSDETAVLVAVHPDSGTFDRPTLDRARTIAPTLGAALTTARRWRSRVASEKARYLAVEADQAMLQHRYELLVSAMDTAVLMESAHGRVSLVNPAFLRLFNLQDGASILYRSAREVEQASAALFTDPTDFLERSIALTTAEGIHFDELQLADGRVLERSTRQVLDADDRLGRIWIYRDVTSRVLSNRALAEALADTERNDHRRQQFMAQLSHEIRSPVQSILGMLDALQSAALSPELSDLVHSVRGSSAQVTHLLTDMLDLSRLDAGKVRIETSTFDPGEVVEEVVESLGGRAADKRLQIDVSVSSDVCRIDSDPARIRQIVTNLVTNAIKYTRQGGVQVRVARVGSRVQIQVSDSGPGLSAEQQQRLFQEYGQVRGSTNAADGVGLGLYISHRLVQRLGGSLSVQSKLSIGTTFTVDLPGPRIAATPAPSRPEVIHLNGGSTHNLEMLREQCASLGLRTGSLAEATHVLALAPPASVEPPQMVIAMVNVGEATPGWAHTAIRGPVTRAALTRALEATAGPPQSDASQPIRLVHASELDRPPLQIIIADDDPTVRHLLDHILRKVQPTPHIRLAETGAEAVAMFLDTPADVVLLDSEMPVMDGRDAAAAIRSYETATVGVPSCLVLGLTGHSEPEHHASLRDAGVDRVFTKPVQPRMLAQLVRTLQTATPTPVRECG